MSKQTIDTYGLTSLEEPSEEILSQLMKEVAEEAKRKGDEATKKFFADLKVYCRQVKQDWNRRYPA